MRENSELENFGWNDSHELMLDCSTPRLILLKKIDKYEFFLTKSCPFNFTNFTANSGLASQLCDGPLESTSDASRSLGLHLTESVFETREDSRDGYCQTSDVTTSDEEDPSSGSQTPR